ncbi:hypothetical protein LTR56_021887 [Elasticomyces elasticus]|nr:hypothetical protein LTR56_021887 [Elasticomyces elasticus]KAK4908974.1 hypothetical protein LTR49_022198 [Elasticomyces elasticus]
MSPTEPAKNMSYSERLQHFTWAWFALPLSTAGIAILLAGTPHRFDGLTTIGKLFFIFALVLYLLAIALITTRFVMFPKMLRCSFVHPHESLFFPTCILTLANIIGCAWIYGSPYCGHWLVVATEVLYWLYMVMALVGAILQYLYLFSAPKHRLTIQGMTPAWILPIFPTLFGGVLASILAGGQPPSSRMAIVISGITFTGLGWMVAILMYSVYIQRLMTFGLPPPNLRPGMFIAVGPPAFTGLALVNFGSVISDLEDYGYFADNSAAIQTLRTVADFTAIFLWMLAFWFFCITLVALITGLRQMSFHLVWWALVFPNIAFALATGRIGQRLRSEGIMWVASAMTLALVATWLFAVVCNVLAVMRRQIMMPGMDEDKECCMEHDEGRDIAADLTAHRA